MSNSGRNKALEAKIMAYKVKYCADELSETSSSTTNSTSKLRTTVSASKKAADQAEINVSALKKRNPGYKEVMPLIGMMYQRRQREETLWAC